MNKQTRERVWRRTNNGVFTLRSSHSCAWLSSLHFAVCRRWPSKREGYTARYPIALSRLTTKQGFKLCNLYPFPNTTVQSQLCTFLPSCPTPSAFMPPTSELESKGSFGANSGARAVKNLEKTGDTILLLDYARPTHDEAGVYNQIIRILS